jgi:hypothetical protein
VPIKGDHVPRAGERGRFRDQSIGEFGVLAALERGQGAMRRFGVFERQFR